MSPIVVTIFYKLKEPPVQMNTTVRQRNPSQGNATFCVVKNNNVRLNHATRVIFYLAHLLFYIILHIVRREYICTLRLIVLS